MKNYTIFIALLFLTTIPLCSYSQKTECVISTSSGIINILTNKYDSTNVLQFSIVGDTIQSVIPLSVTFSKNGMQKTGDIRVNNLRILAVFLKDHDLLVSHWYVPPYGDSSNETELNRRDKLESDIYNILSNCFFSYNNDDFDVTILNEPLYFEFVCRLVVDSTDLSLFTKRQP